MEVAVFLGCWSKGVQGNVIEIKYEDAYEYSKKNVVYIATISIRAPLQKPRKISSINVSYAGKRDRMFEANIRKVILGKIEECFGIELITRSGGKLFLAKKTFFNEIKSEEINETYTKVIPINNMVNNISTRDFETEKEGKNEDKKEYIKKEVQRQEEKNKIEESSKIGQFKCKSQQSKSKVCRVRTDSSKSKSTSKRTESKSTKPELPEGIDY